MCRWLKHAFKYKLCNYSNLSRNFHESEHFSLLIELQLGPRKFAKQNHNSKMIDNYSDTIFYVATTGMLVI